MLQAAGRRRKCGTTGAMGGVKGFSVMAQRSGALRALLLCCLVAWHSGSGSPLLTGSGASPRLPRGGGGRCMRQLLPPAPVARRWAPPCAGRRAAATAGRTATPPQPYAGPGWCHPPPRILPSPPHSAAGAGCLAAPTHRRLDRVLHLGRHQLCTLFRARGARRCGRAPPPAANTPGRAGFPPRGPRRYRRGGEGGLHRRCQWGWPPPPHWSTRAARRRWISDCLKYRRSSSSTSTRLT